MMDVNIQQEVINRLDLIASKLNTTVQFLWQVLVSQARVRGVLDGVEGLGLSSLAYLAYKFARKMYAAYKEDDEDYQIVLSGIACGVVYALGGLSFWALDSSVTELINPQYWALKELLNLLKGNS